MSSLNESIIKIRVELQKKDLNKSGKNKYAGFSYFELSDFLPTLNELMLVEGVNDRFTIKDSEAILQLIKGEETQEYTMPFVVYETPVNKDGKPSMQDIQYLGALNTYYKRYLYLNAFGITDGDVIDSMNNDNLQDAKLELTKRLQKVIVDKGIDLDEVKEFYVSKGLLKEEDNLEKLDLKHYQQMVERLESK